MRGRQSRRAGLVRERSAREFPSHNPGDFGEEEEEAVQSSRSSSSSQRALQDNTGSSQQQHLELSAETWLTKSDGEICVATSESLKEVRRKRLAVAEECAAKRVSLSDLAKECLGPSPRIASCKLQAIDHLLGGGFDATQGEVIEVMGATRSGKTQLCLTLVALQVLSDSCRALFIDTTNAFDAHRIGEIISCHRERSDEGIGDTTSFVAECLKRVDCVQAFDLNSLFEIVDGLMKDSVSPTRYSLIIIDSLSGLVHPLLSKKNAYGNNVVHSLSSILSRVSQKFRCPLVLTTLDVPHEGRGSRHGFAHWVRYVVSQRITLQYQGDDSDSGRFVIQATVDHSTRSAIPGGYLAVRLIVGKEGVQELVVNPSESYDS